MSDSVSYFSEPPTNGKVLLVTTLGELELELWSNEAPQTARCFVQRCLDGDYDGCVVHRIVRGFLMQTGGERVVAERGRSSTSRGGKAAQDDTLATVPVPAPSRPVQLRPEFHSRLRFNRRGIVGMAGADRRVSAAEVKRKRRAMDGNANETEPLQRDDRHDDNDNDNDEGGANSDDPNTSQFFITLDRAEWLTKQHTVFAKVTGATVYNLSQFADVRVDPNDRPLHPPRIVRAEVIDNPFPDVVPRRTTSSSSSSASSASASTGSRSGKQRTSGKVSDRLAKRNASLLSFGDEEGGEEEEEEEAEEEARRGPAQATKRGDDHDDNHDDNDDDTNDGARTARSAKRRHVQRDAKTSPAVSLFDPRLRVAEDDAELPHRQASSDNAGPRVESTSRVESSTLDKQQNKPRGELTRTARDGFRDDAGGADNHTEYDGGHDADWDAAMKKRILAEKNATSSASDISRNGSSANSGSSDAASSSSSSSFSVDAIRSEYDQLKRKLFAPTRSAAFQPTSGSGLSQNDELLTPLEQRRRQFLERKRNANTQQREDSTLAKLEAFRASLRDAKSVALAAPAAARAAARMDGSQSKQPDHDGDDDDKDVNGPSEQSSRDWLRHRVHFQRRPQDFDPAEAKRDDMNELDVYDPRGVEGSNAAPAPRSSRFQQSSSAASRSWSWRGRLFTANRAERR